MTTTLHRIEDERLAGALALLITVAGLAFANFGGSGENGGAAPYAISVAVCAVVTAILFGRVLPRIADPARAAWILAGLGLLTGVAFWSGLPFVLGVGAIYCASRAGRTAPAVAGAVVVAVAFAACVAG